MFQKREKGRGGSYAGYGKGRLSLVCANTLKKRKRVGYPRSLGPILSHVVYMTVQIDSTFISTASTWYSDTLAFLQGLLAASSWCRSWSLSLK